MRTDETIVRVIQALELKESFIYVLNCAQIEYLRNTYIVCIISNMGFGLYDCKIQRNEDHGP